MRRIRKPLSWEAEQPASPAWNWAESLSASKSTKNTLTSPASESRLPWRRGSLILSERKGPFSYPPRRSIAGDTGLPGGGGVSRCFPAWGSIPPVSKRGRMLQAPLLADLGSRGFPPHSHASLNLPDLPGRRVILEDTRRGIAVAAPLNLVK